MDIRRCRRQTVGVRAVIFLPPKTTHGHGQIHDGGRGTERKLM